MTPPDIARLDVSRWGHDLRDVVTAVASSWDSVEDPEFLRRLFVAARGVPDDLVLELRDLLAYERATAVVVSGFSLGDWVGPTPDHWRARGADDSLPCDVYLMLIGAQLGEPFAWQTLQDARILNDILPIRGQEDGQSGHSSRTVHEYHCDDAFHDFRCDYVALLCLRNDHRVPTIVAPLTLEGIDSADVETLRQPRFQIFSDTEHAKSGNSDRADAALAVAVLTGPDDAPRIRIDPPFMAVAPGDDTAAAALDRLSRHLEESLVDVVLEPGEICLIDNHRAVHGRAAFEPRYDGRDRWLRKLLITRDLGKSRTLRAAADSRVIRC